MTVLETMKKIILVLWNSGKANVTIAEQLDVHGKDNLWGGPFSKNKKNGAYNQQ